MKRYWPLAAFLTACASVGGRSGAKGPTLVVTESVVIGESDSIGGFATFFARSEKGELYLADMTQHAVLHYSAEGRFLGKIGKEGSGPGEFELPGSVQLLPGDTLLAVGDINRRMMQLFSLPSGRFVRQVRLQSQDIGTNWEFDGDAARFAMHLVPSAVATWRFADDTVVATGATPAALLRDPYAGMAHGRSDLARSDSGTVLFLPTEPGLLLLDTHDSTRGLVRIPVARRRGEPEDLFERMAAMGRDPGGFTPFASAAVGGHRLGDGGILVAHLDLDRAPGDSPNRGYGGYRLYFSVVRADLSAACVDAEFPLETDVVPIPRFRGDTAFILTRRVVGDEVEARLSAIRVETMGCDWLPTGGLVPVPQR